MKKDSRPSKSLTIEVGARRTAHFEHGGTIAGWRGIAHTFTDRKKEGSKRSCRSGGKFQND